MICAAVSGLMVTKTRLRHHQVEPHQQRHAAHLHAPATHADDGGHNVQRRADGSNAAQKNCQCPVVGAVAGREHLGRERRVGKPTHIGRRSRGVKPASADIAEVEQKARERRDPEAEGVQPWKRHVARADHQRHQVVSKAEQDRHADEEHHRRSVHGKQLIEDLRRNKMIVGHGQLNAHQHRLNARDDQEKQGIGDVHQPDLLVVHRRQPVVHHIQRRPAMPRGQRLVNSFDCMRRAHRECPSGKRLAKLRQIGGHSVQIVVVQVHRRHQAAGLHRIGIVDPLPQILGSVLNRS